MGRKSKFDATFRAQAVELVRLSDRPRCRIAVELGVSDPTIVRWMKEHERHHDDAGPLLESERAELVRLPSENRGLKSKQAELVMEREILKKATFPSEAFITSQQQLSGFVQRVTFTAPVTEYIVLDTATNSRHYPVSCLHDMQTVHNLDCLV